MLKCEEALCYELWVPQDIFKGISKRFIGCFKKVWKVSKESLMCGSGVFLGESVLNVSMML